MAISLVGTKFTGAIDGGDVTVDLTTLSLAQDDVVYAFVGVSHGTVGAVMSSAGWTTVVAIFSSGGATRSALYRKVMGSTPDTSCVVTGSANANDSASVIIVALRGADTTTPEDATPTTANASSTNPDCPSITTVTDNAWVLALATSRVSDTSITAPTGYSNLLTGMADDVDDTPIAVSTKVVATAGAEDPPSYTTWNTGLWCAITVAVRPASTGSTFNEAVVEAVTVAETVDRSIVAVGAAAETLAAAETQASLGAFGHSLAEVLAAAETQASLGSFGHSLAEVLAAAETQAGLGVFGNSLAETITVVDAQTGGLVQTGAVAEVLIGVETQATALVAVGALAEVIAAAETQVGLGVFEKSQAETLAAVDLSSSVLAVFNTVRARAMIVG